MNKIHEDPFENDSLSYSFRQGLSALNLQRCTLPQKESSFNDEIYIADQEVIVKKIAEIEENIKCISDTYILKKIAAIKKATVKSSKGGRPWRFDTGETVWIKNCEIYEWWIGYVITENPNSNSVQVAYFGNRKEMPWIGPYTRLVPLVEGWEQATKSLLGGNICNADLLKRDIIEAVKQFFGKTKIEIIGTEMRWDKYCKYMFQLLLKKEKVRPVPILLGLSNTIGRTAKRFKMSSNHDENILENTPEFLNSIPSGFFLKNNAMNRSRTTNYRINTRSCLKSNSCMFETIRCNNFSTTDFSGSKEACDIISIFFDSINRKDYKTLLLTIGKCVQLNQVDIDTGNYGIHLAIRNNDIKALRILLKASEKNMKADFASKMFDRSGLNPLHLVMKLGRYSMVHDVVQHISNVNALCKNGFTALSWATSKETEDSTEVLKNRFRAVESLLNICCVNSSTTKVNEFISSEKRPVLFINALDKLKRTPLYWTVVNQVPALGMLLLDNGAKFWSSKEQKDLQNDLSLGLEPTPIRLSSRSIDGDFSYPRFFYSLSTIGNSPNEKSSIGCQCTGFCNHTCPCTGLNGQQLPYNDDKVLVLLYKSNIYECGPHCTCECGENGGVLRVSQEGVTTKLEVSHMGKKGWGVITLEELPKGKFLFLYTGVILNKEDSTCDESERNYVVEVVTGLKSNMRIDASAIGNVARLVNHSCEPNLILKKIYCGLSQYQIGFFTNQVIFPGTELTWGYNNAPTKKDFPCLCFSEKCRGQL